MGGGNQGKNTKKLEKARMRGGGCRGVQGVQGCLGGVQGVKTRKTLRNCMASPLHSNIQNFVQEVPVAHPPHIKVLEGEKGEVKPPKCPTRQSGLADTLIQFFREGEKDCIVAWGRRDHAS